VYHALGEQTGDTKAGGSAAPVSLWQGSCHAAPADHPGPPTLPAEDSVERWWRLRAAYGGERAATGLWRTWFVNCGRKGALEQGLGCGSLVAGSSRCGCWLDGSLDESPICLPNLVLPTGVVAPTSSIGIPRCLPSLGGHDRTGAVTTLMLPGAAVDRIPWRLVHSAPAP